MFINSSLIAHSCVSNTLRLFVGDYSILMAKKDIQEGELITMEYADSLSPLKQRKEILS